MKRKVEADHCVFRNNLLMCLHCGGTFTLKLPMDIDDLGKKTKSFIALHKDCTPPDGEKNGGAA
jgi:hypothetical protein